MLELMDGKLGESHCGELHRSARRAQPGKIAAPMYHAPGLNSGLRFDPFDGLIEATPAARRQALLDMFRAVGQVVHLVEDASQPEHVRNEQHVFLGSPIEKSRGEQLPVSNTATFQTTEGKNL